ncbi:MAG: hypothetical protein JWR80_98 [Bradyrhizobium sp.]|jgi:hypothetical protein|nr:hypothetical protein [Bradyrhizobium sp.]
MAKRYNILSRFLAAMALVFVYMVSVVGTSGLFLAASTSSADARGRGRGGGGRGYARGYARGRGRGRGYGYGGVYVAPRVRGGCHYSYRWGRVVCY